MKVFFYPPRDDNNPYVSNVIGGLEDNGATVVNKGVQGKFAKIKLFLTAPFKGIDVFHFNWIENISAIDNKKNRIKSACFLSWMKVVKCMGGKIVWTMHNKESHYASGDRTFHHNFLRKLVSLTDMVVVHAGETRDLLIDSYKYPPEKICFVPHGRYEMVDELQQCKKSGKELVFLAFGIVSEYKNIPMMIESFRSVKMPNAKLFIYGKCKDEKLEKVILDSMKGDDNIIFRNMYVPEEEVANIFSESDVVLLPYKKESMMNSGAAILAFTHGKPIIASEFGSIKDIKDKSFVFSYDYDSDDSHREALANMMQYIYDKWNDTPEDLADLGKAAHEYALTDLSWTTICETIVENYKSI